MNKMDKRDPLRSAIAKSCKTHWNSHPGMYGGELTAVEIIALFKAGATDFAGARWKSDNYTCAVMRKRLGIGGSRLFYFHANGIVMERQ